MKYPINFKRICIVLVIISLSLIPVLNAQTPKGLILKADECLKKNKYDKAEKLIKKAISLSDPKEIDLYIAYCNLGVVQEHLNKLVDALKSYSQSIEIKPNSAFVLNNRAVVKIKMNDFQGAMDDYNTSLLHDSLYVQTYLSKAYLFRLQKDTLSLLNSLNKVLKLSPYNLSARYTLAGLEMEKGNLQASLQVFERLNYEYPNQPAVLNNLSINCMRLDNCDAAMKYINQAINAKPFDFCYVTRAELYLLQGDKKRAMKDLKRALFLKSKDSRIQELIGLCR